MFINNEISINLIIVFISVIIIGLIILLFYNIYNNMMDYLRSKFNCIDECYLNVKFSKALKLSNVKKIKESDTECSICIENGINKFLKLDCDHLFHDKCIKRWIEQQNSCPICRDDIITN